MGMEVPIIGSDDVKWIEVSVPSSRPPAAITVPSLSHPCAPLTKDAASCHFIGDPPHYLIWYSLSLLLLIHRPLNPRVYLLRQG